MPNSRTIVPEQAKGSVVSSFGGSGATMVESFRVYFKLLLLT